VEERQAEAVDLPQHARRHAVREPSVNIQR